jgi:hypothetical protein
MAIFVKPSVSGHGREKLRHSPLAQCLCPALISRALLFQATHILDQPLDLIVGQAFVHWHLVLAILRNVEKQGIGLFGYLRRLEGPRTHPHPSRSRVPIRSMAHLALGFVEGCGILRKGGTRNNERAEQNHCRRSDSISHKIAPWPVMYVFPSNYESYSLRCLVGSDAYHGLLFPQPQANTFLTHSLLPIHSATLPK